MAAGGDASADVAYGLLRAVADCAARVALPPISDAVDVLMRVHARGRRAYAMGNGGSASTASHLVCDLMKTARVDGVPALRAFALVDGAATLTAWANDAAYDAVFSAQLDALVEPGDAVIAISASGNSSNVVEGLRTAARRGAATIALLGCGGGQAARITDVPIVVDSDHFGVIESVHLAIAHALATAVRARLGERVPPPSRGR